MSVIHTAEGEAVVAETRPSSPRLIVEARIKTEKRRTTREIECSAFDLYSKTALRESPRRRGDLTNDALAEIADLVVGRAVYEGHADRRSGVEIERLVVSEEDEAAVVRETLEPSYMEDWPGDGSASDKIRFMLDECPTHSAAEMAEIAGCSRSLVSDVKNSRGDGD